MLRFRVRDSFVKRLDGEGHALLRPAIDDDTHPFTREAFGNGESDARGRTTDESGFILKF